MSEFTDLQRARGREAYLRYCNGVWIAQNPESASELIGQRDFSIDEAKIEVVELVEELVQSGSRNFLQESFPEGVTAFQTARNRRDEIEQNARNLLDQVVEEEKIRLQDMNAAFWRLKPAPFLRGVTMTRLLHGDYEAVPTISMLGDFAAHTMLQEYIANRTLRTRLLGYTATKSAG